MGGGNPVVLFGASLMSSPHKMAIRGQFQKDLDHLLGLFLQMGLELNGELVPQEHLRRKNVGAKGEHQDTEMPQGDPGADGLGDVA